jgi:uncharacterized protein (DUF2252 family)
VPAAAIDRVNEGVGMITRLPDDDELRERGRAQREVVKRSALSRVPKDGRDPMGVLEAQNQDRVPDLLPLRRERMSASVFTFYRGTAAIMASDLAKEPDSGIYVASCGDAHVSNFGFYGSSQRSLLFDLNDFDEAAWAPWEWDVKRLVTSVVVAGRATDRDPDVVADAARATVRAYLRALEADSELDPVSRFYLHFDAASAREGLDPQSQQVLDKAAERARRRTGDRAARRLTALDDQGRVRFVESPPAMTHADEQMIPAMQEAITNYLASAAVDVRLLMRQYRIVDAARRAVGVGSVGTRCYLFLLQDGDGHSMILQAKQAGRSVLEEYGHAPQPDELTEAIAINGEGARVVGLQHILQAQSDPFLGHLPGLVGDFYVRQFHDMKGGIEIDTLDDIPFGRYAAACAVLLARAHGQSGNSPEILGYAGKGKSVVRNLVEWAYAYADVAEKDYAEFLG